MTRGDLLRTSFGNLGRHPVRTVLSAIGVTVGILTIVTMVSLGVGVQKEILQQFQGAGLETISVRPVTEERSAYTAFAEPKRTVLITPELVEEMRAREDVIEVLPRVYVPWGATVYLQAGDRELNVRVYVGDSTWGLNDPFTEFPRLESGRELVQDSPGEVILSKDALEALGYDEQSDWEDVIGQEVHLLLKAPRGDMASFPLVVAGVRDTTYWGANIGVTDALALKSWWYNDPDILEHEGYDMLRIKAASINDAAQIVGELQEQGFEVESLRLLLDNINRAMVVLQTMLGSIGALALLVASIGIANTMIMSVYERTREIGILKAIGASPGDIRALFIAESAFIGLAGGVAGTILGWLLGLGLNRLILAILRWQEAPVRGTFFVVTGWLVLLALAFATVVGLLSGLYPAARAARLDPIEALRYE
jgi:ABC-type lipoprotein release transport system permease subunit